MGAPAPIADLGGRVCVLTQKSSGKWVLFQAYADPADAQRVADRLRSFGARVDLRPEQQQEVAPDPSEGKAFAMMLFNVGARTEAETADAFAAHPEWRNA